MGYDVLNKTPLGGAKKYFDAQFSRDGRKVVASGMHGRGEYYAAVSTKCGNHVYAVVVVIDRTGGEFAYKIMGENELPYYYNAPQSVVDALTDNTDKTACAWRTAVFFRLHMAAKWDAVNTGDVVKFDRPINFGGVWGKHDTFRVVRKGNRHEFYAENYTGARFGITNYRAKAFVKI